MFLVYLPLSGLFSTAVGIATQLIRAVFPQLMMDELMDHPDEESFIRCVKAMGALSAVPAAKPRNPVDEEKIRSQFIAALNLYSTALYMASTMATNANDKAKILANSRMVQYLLSKLYNPVEWATIADAIWGATE